MKIVKLFTFDDLKEVSGELLVKIAVQDIGQKALSNNAAYEHQVGYGLEDFKDMTTIQEVEAAGITRKEFRALEEIRDFFLVKGCKLGELVYINRI